MLNPKELLRYSRHLRLPGVGPEQQAQLGRARVLIIGMGGLGSSAALYLAAAGVGTLGLADFDKVEGHNLQRQVIHTEDWIGRPKLNSAIERLKAINGSLNLCLHDLEVTPHNAVSLFADYDLILDGSDNFPTRYLNNDAAFFAQKPLIYGSVFQFEGQLSIFHPRTGGPCYRCLFPSMPQPGSIPNCDEAGVIGALCGIIGSYQALEAIKLLIGIGKPMLGQLLVIDTLGNRTRQIALKPAPDCPLCGSNPEIKAIEASRYASPCQPQTSTPMPEIPALEISVVEAQAIQKANPETIFLDVREPFETDICMIPGARHIPMRQITERLSELPSDKPLLVYCHHGQRSLRVTETLRARNFSKAQSIQGGIHAWAKGELTPGMAQY